MYKLGIIGYGVVGKGIHRLLKDEVKGIYDPYINDEGKELSKTLGKQEYVFDSKEVFSSLDRKSVV